MEKPVPMQKTARTKVRVCNFLYIPAISRNFFTLYLLFPLYILHFIELSTLKNEDTSGESATPQRPGSAVKSARPRTGTNNI